MLETLSQLGFSWGQVTTAIVAIIAALALARVPVGRLHRRRVIVIVTALAASIALHLGAMGLDTLNTGGSWQPLHAAAVLLLAFGLTGLVGLLLFDLAFQRARLTVPTILRDILQALAFVVILFAVLRKSGVNLLSLVTTSAVLTAVIGLSLQHTIANMFAGLSLQLDKTLSVGDWIQWSTWVGRITHIKWRSTFIITRDGNNVIMPNSELLKQEVLNFSKPTGVHRSNVKCTFAYHHPPREVARVLTGALRGMIDILDEPQPDCLPVEFGENGITYVLRYWTENVQRDIIVEGEVRVRVWYAAQRAGLEIPVPQLQLSGTATPRLLAGSAALQEHDRLQALAGVDLFAALDTPTRAILAAGLKRQLFASDELIIKQGDIGDSLYVIHSGQVAVTLAFDHQVREVARLKAGQFFGEMSLLTGEPRNATCRALSDVECWVIDHEALRGVLVDNPKIAEDMSSILAGRQQQLDGQRAHVASTAKRVPDQRMLARIRNFFGLGA
jgi:small-conductance mechanosensitive channel/CRP-like cAMP-binding protein